MATLTSSFYWVFVLLAAGIGALGVSILWRAMLADRSRGRRRCPKCWYEMTGVPGLRCPECGVEAKHERVLFRTRRRALPALAGVLLMLLGVATAVGPRVWEKGWIGAIPTWALIPAMYVWDTSNSDLFCEFDSRTVDPTTLPVPGRWLVRRTAAWHVEHGGIAVLRPVPPARSAAGSPSVPLLSGIPVVGNWFRPAADTRQVGLRLLESLGPESRPELDVIVHAIGSPDGGIWQMALHTMAVVKPPHTDVLSLAVPLLQSPDIGRRIGAARCIAALQEGGEPAIDALATAMRDSPAAFAEHGFNTLESIGHAAAPRMLELLADPAVPERHRAFMILYRLGPQRCHPQPTLLRMLAEDPDAECRHGAAELMGYYGYFNRGDPEVIAAAERALANDSSGRVRNTALWLLHGVCDDRDQVTAAIIRSFSDPNPDVRYQALRFGAFDGLPDSARAAVAALTEDTDSSVSWAAAEALRTVWP